MPGSLISIAPGGRCLLDAHGRPFFAVIVNYVGHTDRAWAQFQTGRFDPALIEADFRLARQLGANTVRTFVAAPLQNEFPKGDWSKLDALVEAASRAGVYLWLTLADYSLSYVRTLADHAGMIASRYADHPAILALDLKNEPRFYHLALMRYPAGNPLLADTLSAAYPPRRSPGEALAWARGEGKSGSLPEEEAIRYAHASDLLDRFLQAAGNWTAAQNYRASVVSFIRSAEAAAWRPFLEVLNATLAAWLGPQVQAVRAAAPRRLITVGYSDPLLAALPANLALDFHAINRYPRDASPRQLEFQTMIAGELLATFPGRPVILSEFGYATNELEPAQAAICESTAWLRAAELELAGAGKWMLWDLPPGPNPRERSFGLFDPDGRPKPAALALPALARRLRPARGMRGRLQIGANPNGAIAYRYEAADALFASGNGQAGEGGLRWEGDGYGQLLADWSEPGMLRVTTTARGQVTVDLGQLLGMRKPHPAAVLAGDAAWPHTRAGSVLVFQALPGQQVQITLSLEVVEARIAILWPHGDKPVSEARLANLTAYLTYPDCRVSAPCDFDRPVTLWRALNNEPAEPIAIGQRRMADLNGQRVPVWDFNDIDVSPARDPRNKLYFTLQVEGFPYRSNVWVHGVDARTYMPLPASATAEQPVNARTAPETLDARIQILWPHAGAAVAQANLANLSADLFVSRTLIRLAPDPAADQPWDPQVWLVAARNNEPGERVCRGVLRVDERKAAHWDFNDVDVSPARNPENKLHFWIEVEGHHVRSNFWTHGADARTYLPNPETPLGNCP